MERIKEINKINEINIKIKHGEQVQEVTQKTGVEEEGKDKNNYFEFQSINKEEYLELILQAKNKSGDIIYIGSKAYSLEGINILKKYLVLIDIPEAFKEGKESNKMGEIIFAEIMMNFSLIPSYELQTRKEEPNLKKINIDIKQDEEYEKTNQDIFAGKIGNYKFVKSPNKESLTKKNKLENDFNNRNTFGSSKPYDCIVEFNNVRYDSITSKGFKLEFNNILEVKSKRKILPSNKEEKIQMNEEQNEQLKKNQSKELKKNEKIENEFLVEQKENMEVRMDEQKYTDLLYSESQKINIKEYKNLEVNNINFEYIQKHDINIESMEYYSENNAKHEYKNKMLVEENILSLEYLPEKANKVIGNNNIYSLAPYNIKIQDPFILNIPFNDKINLKFIIKININFNIINKF
jgi:hypothetical protein